MKEKQIWKDYLPVEMKEHWTVYECLKESEDSATFLVKETLFRRSHVHNRTDG